MLKLMTCDPLQDPPAPQQVAALAQAPLHPAPAAAPVPVEVLRHRPQETVVAALHAAVAAPQPAVVVHRHLQKAALQDQVLTTAQATAQAQVQHKTIQPLLLRSLRECAPKCAGYATQGWNKPETLALTQDLCPSYGLVTPTQLLLDSL